MVCCIAMILSCLFGLLFVFCLFLCFFVSLSVFLIYLHCAQESGANDIQL